jgi:hypothetical protein
MKADSPEKLLSAKCATALFSMCVVLAVAAWLLNRSIAEARAGHRKAMARYDGAEQMLGRLRAYQSRNASFFEDLTWCAIASFGSKVEIRHSLLDGSGFGYHVSGDAPKELTEYVFLDAVRQFGSNAAVIVSTSRTPEQRFEQLASALTNAFAKTNIQKAARVRVFGGPIFYRGLGTNALWRMSHIDQRAEWGGIAAWLAFSEWPPIPSEGTGNAGRGISYTDRFPEKWSSYDEECYNYDLLLAADPAQAESILAGNWAKARESALSPVSPQAQLSMPGTQLALNVPDLLMVSGPIVVFCQCLFLIFRKQEKREFDALPAAELSFAFPQFSCPDEPLTAPTPSSVAEFAERAIWLLFLVLPPLLLAFGVLTRFDVITAGETLMGVPWLQSLLLARTPDVASALLDVLNLCCFGVSFWVLLEIARPSGHKSSHSKGASSGPLLPARFVVVTFTVTFALLFLLRWDRGLFWNAWRDTWQQAVFMVAFVLLVSRCLVVASRRRSLTAVLVAAALLLVLLRLAS